MLKDTVMGKMERQLDIRSFLKMYLDVRLIIKRTMTMDQRKLFALQRDRLALLEDEDSFDSDLDVDRDIRDPDAVRKFSNQITEHRIESDLDRKLLLGVLVRDHSLRKMKFGNDLGQEQRLTVVDLDYT